MIKKEEVYKIGRIGKPHGVKGELSFHFDDDVFDRVDADYLILDMEDILVPFFMDEYRFRSDETALMKFTGINTEDTMYTFRVHWPTIPTAFHRQHSLLALTLLMLTMERSWES